MSTTDTGAEDRYFQIHGLEAVAPERLNESLKTAIAQLEVDLYGSSRSELTVAEVAAFERAGVDLDEHPDASDPLMDYATEFAAILATSLTPAQVADRLGVTAVRVRQMIRDHAVYAVRVEGRWHVPAYQFDYGALVPNIGRVNRALEGLDPVSLHRWITGGDPELEDENGTAMTPLNWLKSGRDVAAVLRIAPER